MYFGKEINEYWTFNLPHKNGSFKRPSRTTKFTAEIINTWEMTITPVKETFETAAVEDYRLYDIDRKKIRLPLKPYLALRIKAVF